MSNEIGTVEHYEVSFSDGDNRRTALAHSEDQMLEVATGFAHAGLQEVAVHKVTTTRAPHPVDIPPPPLPNEEPAREVETFYAPGFQPTEGDQQ